MVAPGSGAWHSPRSGGQMRLQNLQKVEGVWQPLAGMDESLRLKAETKLTLGGSWLGWVEDPTLRWKEFGVSR